MTLCRWGENKVDESSSFIFQNRLTGSTWPACATGDVKNLVLWVAYSVPGPFNYEIDLHCYCTDRCKLTSDKYLP